MTVDRDEQAGVSGLPGQHKPVVTLAHRGADSLDDSYRARQHLLGHLNHRRITTELVHDRRCPCTGSAGATPDPVPLCLAAVGRIDQLDDQVFGTAPGVPERFTRRDEPVPLGAIECPAVTGPGLGIRVLDVQTAFGRVRLLDQLRGVAPSTGLQALSLCLLCAGGRCPSSAG
ncbi:MULTISPECIES: hypothetical protein [Nocardiopsis]|uniref:hypothetical protein n=1 Tax=Nocardiopsis TaxID=2013 RepID=UPI00117F0385|nr:MULTISPECIES: hypothetical protein [Nocardiopsis]